ncbi:MAG TPA: Phenylacetic acid catabolic protein [Candidatus Dormibacteraeota bacterium]
MSDELSGLVLALADNKQLLGLRYAEWATRSPSLEADIAAAAMGLDDLGHSRVLYGCLEPLGSDPRGPERETDPASYANLAYFDQPWSAWDEFVAANAVLDTAFSVVIESLVEGPNEVLRSRLRKMLQEEHYHFLHGRSWLRQGSDGQFLDRAWREAVSFLGPPDGQLAALAARLAERLETDVPQLDIDWSTWDPVRRRLEPGGIDPQTFAMMRGLEERRFTPAAS